MPAARNRPRDDRHRRDPQTLTVRQEAILDCIEESVRSRGYPPSMREIGHAVGLDSPSSVHHQVLTLQAKGYLHRDPVTPRAYTLRDPRPPVDALAALLAKVADAVPLPGELAADGRHFALRMAGTAMTAAAIHDADLLLVDQHARAADGDLVAALVDGHATIRVLHRDGTRIRLATATAGHRTHQAADTDILGRVIAVIRHL
jgi:repressor LexA